MRRFRHPMAHRRPVRHLAMAVVVARRGGLHAAATRFAAAGPPRTRNSRPSGPGCCALSAPRWPRAGTEPVRRRARRAGPRLRPGRSPGRLGRALPGGPIGYAQREFEIAPCQRDSRWYGTAVGPGHAVAWNPSLPGGAKAEDTYLVNRRRAGAPDHRDRAGPGLRETTGGRTAAGRARRWDWRWRGVTLGAEQAQPVRSEPGCRGEPQAGAGDGSRIRPADRMQQADQMQG